jgi:hypothetical protein
MMEFHEALRNAIEGWKADPIADEWLLEKLREKFIDATSPSEAFELIDETIKILCLESDESTAIKILQTVIGLARHSETTEIPRGLLLRKEMLREKFSNFGDYARSKLSELFRYYRL